MLASAFWANREPTSGGGSVTVTPSDTAALVNPATGQTEIALGFYVEAACTVAFVCADGNLDAVTFTAAGEYPVPVRLIKATGTTGGAVIHAIF